MPCRINHDISLIGEILAEADGPRVRYSSANRRTRLTTPSQPITCVQLGTGPAFGDERLERTWVHHAERFRPARFGVA